MMLPHTKEVDRLGGQGRWTSNHQTQPHSAGNTADIIEFEPYSEENSLLYTTVNLGNLDMSNIVVHPDCPRSVVKYIQMKVEWTIPVLNWLHPNDPCWKYMSKPLKGYAKHNPKRCTYLPEEARNCSTQLSRFIYRWLYYPIEGLSRKYDVDHTCGRGTNKCINPRHLQLLTPKMNKELGNRDWMRT